jgi:hypothetical protein
MFLLIINNDTLIKYKGNYNNDDMDNFLNKVIEEYGVFTQLELKLKNERDIKRYGDAYRDIVLLKTYQNNSRLHQGRKRVKRKPQAPKYLFRFTAIYYPPIYFVIKDWLANNEIDLTQMKNRLDDYLEYKECFKDLFSILNFKVIEKRRLNVGKVNKNVPEILSPTYLSDSIDIDSLFNLEGLDSGFRIPVVQSLKQLVNEIKRGQSNGQILNQIDKNIVLNDEGNDIKKLSL